MKYWIGIIASVVCLLSCTKTTYNRYKTFPEEVMLTSEVIPLDSALFRYPFRIQVKDSLALVLDLHNPDYFMQAFTYPEWKFIASFGKRGQGPEELLSAETFRFLSPDSIWVLDAHKMQITRWRLSAGDRPSTPEEVVHLDKSLIRVLDFYVTEGGFVVPDYSGQYRFHLLDRQGKCIASKGHIPSETTDRESASPALAQAWRSFMAYAPRSGVWAMVTQLGEALEIYHPNDSIPLVFYGPQGEPTFREVEGESIPAGIMGFSDIQITDSRIYAVFHGRSFKDILRIYQQGGKHEDGGRFLYVFDLKGNPVRKYQLDQAVYGIDVHEEWNMIFATDVNHDQPLLKYTLSW
jgi:hypothetical protein